MLVIISDLHLTDGTSGETIKEGAFRIFRARLRDMAYDASWRADGKYQPIESLDVLLLGDILDVIRSTRWLEAAPDAPNPVRPWDDPQSQPFIDKVTAINQAILVHNAGALAVLKGLDDGDTITIPPATAAGEPVNVRWEPDSPGRVPVKVRLHYMVGNHDWFYHLPGPAYEALRQSVVAAIGLTTLANQPFPHDPTESPLLLDLFRQHRVFARHGDIFDPYNYDSHRDAASLGDAVVIELLNRFGVEVTTRLGEDLPPACIQGLREIDNVRPNLLVPVWLNGLLQRTVWDPDLTDTLKQTWDNLAEGFINLPFVRSHDTKSMFDSVDTLEWALKFSKGISIQQASQVVSWLQEKLGDRSTSSYKNALTEPTFKDRSTRFIVHGHTHHHEVAPLDIFQSNLRSRAVQQLYFNSGTWRQVHELARFRPSQHEFLGYHVMTYLAFYKDNERRGRPFEAWSGVLAPE
jgi:UDP-2,3-diacylglucosamine pyrophosphatase LpxH